MVYRRETGANSVELQVEGDLTTATVADFRTALYAELEQPSRQISLNLAKVRVINSAGIGVILLFKRRAQENRRDVVISAISDELRKTFTAIRIDGIIATGAKETSRAAS
jgi:anti-anti-sigma factor